MSGFMYQGHACAGNDGKGSTGNPGHNSNELTYAYTNKYRHKHKYTVLIKYTKLWMTHNTYNSSKFYLSPLHFLLSSSPPTHGFLGLTPVYSETTAFFKTSPFYGGLRSAGCWLSRAVGSQNAVVLMLRKLLLLEGS